MAAPATLSFMSARPGKTGQADFAPLFALFDLIVAWCRDRASRVKECYIELAPDGLALYVVGKTDPFDFELNKELADFAVSLAEKNVPIYASLLPASAPVEPNAGPVFKVQLS
jgi:hypothetical protein